MRTRIRMIMSALLLVSPLLLASCGEMTREESNQLLAEEHFNAGMKKFADHDYEVARLELAKALSLDESNAEVANALGWVNTIMDEKSGWRPPEDAESEEPEAAEPEAEAAEESDEDEGDSPGADVTEALARLMEAAREAIETGEIGPVVEACDDVLRLLDPQSPEYLAVSILRGAGLLAMEDFQAAAQAASELMAAAPDNVEVLRVASTAYYYAGDLELSDRLTERFYQMAPEDAMAQNNMAYSLAERGRDLDTAYGLARQALAAEPENPSYLDTMGWVYYQAGNYGNALAYVGAALQGDLRGVERELVLSHYRAIEARAGR